MTTDFVPYSCVDLTATRKRLIEQGKPSPEQLTALGYGTIKEYYEAEIAERFPPQTMTKKKKARVNKKQLF